MVSNIKNLHSVLKQFLNFFFCYKNKRSKFEVEKVSIWQYFSISGNTDIQFFNICVLSFSNKKLHYNRGGQQFFYAPCNRVTSSLQERNHHKAISLTKTLKVNKTAMKMFLKKSVVRSRF